ncbi:MAG: DUF3310 domain-containing protein [Clostridia bacterium]|nr:DUF3310 domain-containing protein [Clostridia bacterium]
MDKCKRFDGNDASCRDCALNDLETLNSCYLPEEKSSQVNHPTHYKQEGRRECIEEMRIMFGDDAVYKWAVMTAYKYRYRAGNKADNSAEQDHAKAEWYLSYAESLKAVKKLEDAGFRVKRNV